MKEGARRGSGLRHFFLENKDEKKEERLILAARQRKLPRPPFLSHFPYFSPFVDGTGTAAAALLVVRRSEGSMN